MKRKNVKKVIEIHKPDKKSTLYKVATIFSRLFDPFITIGGVSVLAVFRSGLSGWPLVIFLFGVVFATILFLFVLLHWAVKKGHLSNWDLSNRKERILPLFIAMGVLVIDVINARFFINDFLVDLFILYIFWMMGFFLITLFWKISGHAAGTTLAAGLLIRWIGWDAWPVILSIPLVSWARIVRKDHSVAQIVAGVLYSLAILTWI